LAEMEEDFEKDFELLADMTWDDHPLEDSHGDLSHSDKDDDSDELNQKIHEERNGINWNDDNQEEIEVLNQLIEEIKEFTPIQNSEIQDVESDRQVSLVSRSKDAKIEISWEMMRNWDQNCEVAQSENVDC
jgi:DNA replicative helicase MCM subunit Mcm2 (Cdc46/Mcm family)